MFWFRSNSFLLWVSQQMFEGIGGGGGAMLGGWMGGVECLCGRKTGWKFSMKTGNEIEILFLGFPTYIFTILHHALSYFFCHYYTQYETKKVLPPLYAMIAFFTGFRIKNSTQRWPLKFLVIGSTFSGALFLWVLFKSWEKPRASDWTSVILKIDESRASNIRKRMFSAVI